MIDADFRIIDDFTARVGGHGLIPLGSSESVRSFTFTSIGSPQQIRNAPCFSKGWVQIPPAPTCSETIYRLCEYLGLELVERPESAATPPKTPPAKRSAAKAAGKSKAARKR